MSLELSSSPEAYKYAMDLARWTKEWYDGKNVRKKFWSFVWRSMAIVATGLAPLIPVVAWAVDSNSKPLFQFGYIAALLAIFFLTIDRQFGFTSSWVRTVLASRSVETALAEFQAKWLALAVRCSPAATEPERVELVREFLLKLRSLVDGEAQTWATETLANFSQLERSVSAAADDARKRYEGAADVARSGAVQLTIENPPQGSWTCTVFANSKPYRENWSSPSLGLVNLSPGIVEIRVVAKDQAGAEWDGSQAVSVQSGVITSASIKLTRG